MNNGIKHGDSHRDHKHKLYMIWSSIRQKCINPNHLKYNKYGARGIKVCDEWNNLETGYSSFKEWAYNNGYNDNDKFMLHRHNTNGDYCPENCYFYKIGSSKKKKTIMKKIKTSKSNIKHGDARSGKHSHLYSIWTEMRYRCNNPNHASYKNYGALGITVCPEWNNLENGYDNFKKWALANGYKDGLSIERNDVSFGYFPENCSWISIIDQSYNKRKTKYGIIGKYAFPIMIWVKIVKVNPSTVYHRINNFNWDPIDAILTPADAPKGKHISEIYIPQKYLKYNKYDILLKHNKIPDSKYDMDFKIYIIDD